MTTKETTFDLSDAERSAQRDFDEAQQLRSELLTDLAAGNDVQDQLDAIDEEIATTKRQLARFAETRAVQARASTASAKQTRHEQTIARLADGVLGAEKLAELATDVLGTLAQLRSQLDAIEAQRKATYDTLQGTVVDSQHGAPNERIAMEMRHQLLIYVNALTLPTHFLVELHAAGVGEKGVVVPKDLIEITVPPFDGAPTVAADVERALAQVHKAAAAIEQWSANTTAKSAA